MSTFEGLVKRLGVQTSDLGDCFLYGNLAKLTLVMKGGNRVGLFLFSIRLIDRPQYVKERGCIEHDIEADWCQMLNECALHALATTLILLV